MAQQPAIQAALVPSVIPAGVPPGLEFLLPTNQIIVQEIREHGFFASNYNKQYNILDCWGRRMFFAAENSAMSSSCGGNIRSWVIDVLNGYGQPVLTGSRSGGGGCDTNQCYVMSTPTQMNLGGIVQEGSFGTDKFTIIDGAGAPVLRLDSPLFKSGHSEFPLLTMQMQQVGRISRDFTGFFVTQDVFGVEFPVNLDVKTKAVLIYAAFLIDFMYYEEQGRRHRR